MHTKKQGHSLFFLIFQDFFSASSFCRESVYILIRSSSGKVSSNTARLNPVAGELLGQNSYLYHFQS